MCRLYKALPRKAISCWSWLKAKQPAYPTSGPGQCLWSVFEYSSVNESHWLKAHSNACRSQFAKNHLPRVFGVQQFPKNYFGRHMPCDIPSMVARCRWTKAHSSSLANHIFFMNWTFTTIHRWGELGANCPSPARTPISVTLWSHVWNLRKDPVRDERVRLYDERRWFEKRTCFIAVIFGMHPFHVFNTLFYLFWFVSHKFWHISSGMLSCGLQYKLQKLCFCRTRGSSPHGTRRQRRQERWPKNAETEAFAGISWSCPSY